MMVMLMLFFSSGLKVFWVCLRQGVFRYWCEVLFGLLVLQVVVFLNVYVMVILGLMWCGKFSFLSLVQLLVIWVYLFSFYEGWLLWLISFIKVCFLLLRWLLKVQVSVVCFFISSMKWVYMCDQFLLLQELLLFVVNLLNQVGVVMLFLMSVVFQLLLIGFLVQKFMVLQVVC